jgi:hypothetical protein
VKLNSYNIDTDAKREACLKLCEKVPGATGCETIKNQGNRGCYAHTSSIARGNNARNHKCWVFAKCTKKPNVPPKVVTFTGRYGKVTKVFTSKAARAKWLKYMKKRTEEERRRKAAAAKAKRERSYKSKA